MTGIDGLVVIENEPERKERILRESLKQPNRMAYVDMECALWTAEIADQFFSKPIPMKPKEVEEYEMIPAEARAEMGASYYNEHPMIKPYYQAIHRARVINTRNYEWLRWCRDLLARESKPAQVLDIARAISTFTPECMLQKQVKHEGDRHA